MAKLKLAEIPSEEQVRWRMNQASLRELRAIPEHVFSVLQYDQDPEVIERLRSIAQLALEKIREREFSHGTQNSEE